VISISRLLCDTVSPGDSLRYSDAKSQAHGAIKRGTHEIARPVVVWNCTRQCNLSCLHCYASANNQRSPGELDSEAGKAFIRDLAAFEVPVLLFSGGEPLIRRDVFDMVEYARGQGLRVALSTNGTVINDEVADTLKQLGFAEVGISLDGIGAKNDHFRGKDGAFDSALRGIRSCAKLGLRVSLRLTITRFNVDEVPGIMQLVEDEGIQRVCFYHLAYSGRGTSLRDNDVDHQQTRDVVDMICDWTTDLHQRGNSKEILTVGNHTDGVYLYLKLKETDPERAEIVYDMIKGNGGNNTGVRIGAVDDCGNVHPDQFWWHHTLGNVTERPFGEIWSDTSQPLLAGLKDRKPLLKGRCAACQYLNLCNGNLRVRAEAVTGDVWGSDPACYLTDEEIGVAQ
jgi:radical SAM protein with 4Fe4S-binding SPASM domain